MFVCGLVGVRKAWTEHKQKLKQVLECEVRQAGKVCFTESECCQRGELLLGQTYKTNRCPYISVRKKVGEESSILKREYLYLPMLL